LNLLYTDGTAVAGFSPLQNGAKIVLSQLKNLPLTIAAVDPVTTYKQILFNLDGTYSHIEHDAPYDLCGDNGSSSYDSCSALLTVGSHTLTVTATDASAG
jgi:hypothetical protein